jgi:hypothetical protein
MKLLSILVPTLGRPSLEAPLFNLSTWERQLDPDDRDLIEFVLFHNKHGAISKDITPVARKLLAELNFRIIESQNFLDGAELSLRSGLNSVQTRYCLPVADDSTLDIEGLNLALAYAKDGRYPWVHFNSQVIVKGRNTIPNLNLFGGTFETDAKQLLTRIGLNYSICNISRSLIDVTLLNYKLWDSQINAKKDNWSFGFTLLASMKKSEILLVNQPLQIYNCHNYDHNGENWVDQWSKHGERRGYAPFNDFTTHLTQMHQDLIEIGVCVSRDLEFAVVCENEILRPLATELIWHTINQLIWANSRREFQFNLEDWESHCNFLARTFPIFGHVIALLRVQSGGQNFLPNLETLNKARDLVLDIETPNKIGSLFTLGNRVGNYVNVPEGIYEILEEKFDARTVIKYMDFASDNRSSRFYENARSIINIQESRNRNVHFPPVNGEMYYVSNNLESLVASKLRNIYSKLPRVMRKVILKLAKKIL